MIDDHAFAAGRGALDHLAVPAEEQGVQRPPSGRRGPVQSSIRPYRAGEIDWRPAGPVCHQREQRQGLGKANLLDREGLEIGVRLDRIFHVRDRKAATAAARHADRAEQRRLFEPDRFAETLPAFHVPGAHRHGSRRVRVVHPRPAERPTGAGRHVDAESEAPRFTHRVSKQAHPALAQVLDMLRLVADDAVDRCDLDAADPGGAQRLELRSDAGGIDGASQPPPPRPGTLLAGDRRPHRRPLRFDDDRDGEREDGGKRQPREKKTAFHRCSEHDASR
jgi:hypothetical protein